MPTAYDIIVIGAGHAGCEAAHAAARMGCRVLLLTIDLEKIAAMPCSPSIGGMAKGHLVKEIDALGGLMARISDQSAIQYRTLNTRKGPAVRATRTQNDKNRYHLLMKRLLERHPDIDIKQAQVEKLLVTEGRVTGVEDATGYVFESAAVLLTTGTFLSGRIHIGHRSMEAGRAGECASYGLARSLRDLGLCLGRMKTGTPPRLRRSSIDFSVFERQDGDPCPRPFSWDTVAPPLPQQPCYIGHTNPRTHQRRRDNLTRSALYGGKITGTPARYCPSFEDKIVRFSDRDRHQIILEPEGLETEEIYASGLGNSLPLELQVAFVHSVRGLEQAEIMRPAYAIEYDYCNPVQLHPTLEHKAISGLFCAGQINGTSGYEEAAAQGLWAGVNAACHVQHRPPFILDRSQAYMAVMIDDLVTRGTAEPYRMFTSRAEYRLLLREDNADLRLSAIGREFGLVESQRHAAVIHLQETVDAERQRLRQTTLRPENATQQLLALREQPPLDTGIKAEQLLRRDGISYTDIARLTPPATPLSAREAEQVELEVKYEGYIQRQRRDVERFRQAESLRIPAQFDYTRVHGLSNELKQRLGTIQPVSIGQMQRIEGITPAAIAAVTITLRQRSAAPG